MERCASVCVLCVNVLLALWIGVSAIQGNFSGAPGGLGSWVVHGRPTVDTPFAWDTTNVTLLVVITLCALLANSCGIGGGPFYLALFNSVLGFDLTSTVALSHTITTMSTVASTAYGLLMQHPEEPLACLIDFDIALTFMPALLFGVSVGVLVNTVLPDWLKIVALTFIYAYVVQKTFKKAAKAWRQEDERRAAALEPAAAPPSSLPSVDVDVDQADAYAALTKPLLQEGSASTAQWGSYQDGSRRVLARLSSTNVSGTSDEHIHLVLTYRSRSRQDFTRVDLDEGHLHHEEDFWGGARSVISRIPWTRLVQAVALWGVFLVLQSFKAHHGRCTWQYWAMWAVQATVAAAWTSVYLLRALRLAHTHPERLAPEMRGILLGNEDAEGGVGSPLEALLVVLLMMFLGGLLAGATGIGGALIFNPYLLGAGAHPQVVASTAVFIVFFSSSSIALSFYFQGLLNVSYAQVFDVAGFAASLVGVIVVGRIVRASGRPSIIIYILASMIALSATCTVLIGGYRAVSAWQAGEGSGFRPFCGP